MPRISSTSRASRRSERQTLSMIFNKMQAPTGTIEMRPGPAAAVAGEPHRRARAAGAVDRRRHAARSARQAPAVPHREALAHQPDLPRHLSHRHARRRSAAEDHQPDVPVHRPQGSTELYERVGDLVAYDLVREHFRVLHEIVAAEAGAVVKTIGDAVMATFPTPDRALPRRCACASDARCTSAERRICC